TFHASTPSSASALVPRWRIVSPRRSTRTKVENSEVSPSAVRRAGRVVLRSGLHTGEIERRGADVGGLAVHIAAYPTSGNCSPSNSDDDRLGARRRGHDLASTWKRHQGCLSLAGGRTNDVTTPR